MNSELLDSLMVLNDDMINALVNKKLILEDRFADMHISQGIDEAFSTEGVLFKKYLSLIKNPDNSDEYILKMAKINSLLSDYEDFNLDRTSLINEIISEYCDECGAGIQAFDNAFEEVGNKIDKIINSKIRTNKKLVLKRWGYHLFLIYF